jgi:hypothetical protein
LALLVLLEPQALLQPLLLAQQLQAQQEQTHLLLTQAHRLLRFLTSLFLAATLALLVRQDQLAQLDPLEAPALQAHKGRRAFKAQLARLDPLALLRLFPAQQDQ